MSSGCRYRRSPMTTTTTCWRSRSVARTRYPVVLRQFMFRPQTIAVEESGQSTPSAILVTDASGDRTLIRMFQPATLEA